MSQYKKPDVKKMQAACDKFNALCPPGGRVNVMLDGADKPFATTTRGEAYIMGGHSAVIHLDGVSGCYDLERVTPFPNQGPTAADLPDTEGGSCD